MKKLSSFPPYFFNRLTINALLVFLCLCSTSVYAQTVDWTANAKVHNNHYVSCDGNGGNLSIESSIALGGKSYNPSINSGADFHDHTVRLVGEKINGSLVGIHTTGGIYQFPVKNFAPGVTKFFYIPKDVFKVHLIIDQGTQYHPSLATTPNNNPNAYSPDDKYTFYVWNQAPDHSITTPNLTICTGHPVQLTSTHNTVPNSPNSPQVKIEWRVSTNATVIGTGTNITVYPNSNTTYTATFSINGNTCSEIDYVSVQVVNDPVVSLTTNSACNGAPFGSIDVSLVGYSNWTWFNQYVKLYKSTGTVVDPNNLIHNQVGLTRTIDKIPPGDYYLVIKRPSGCGDYTTPVFTIHQDVSPNTGVTSIAQPKCNGDKGAIYLSNPTNGSAAPFTYNWHGPNGYFNVVGTNALNLVPGTYSVSITSAKGCISTLNGLTINPVTVPPLSVSIGNISNPTCYGKNNGGISLSISGGNQPTVTWSNGMSGSSISSLIAGTYTYTVTDQNGCQKTGSATLNYSISSGITVNETITHSSCQGTNDGAITLNSAGANYSYAWSTGANGPTIANLVSGNYNVVITNNTAPFIGCKMVKHYGVNDNGPSNWHKNTQNTSSENDKIIKVITDAQNNVYSLGEFTGSTEIDGQQIQASTSGNNQKGLFVSQHNSCGQLRWIVYTNSTTSIDIKGLEIAFDGTDHLRVFGQLEDQGAVDFDINSTNGSSLTLMPSGNYDVFSARIGRGTGDLSNSQEYEIPYTDKVNGAAINNNSHYFAGQFLGKAEVKEHANNSLSTLFGETSASGSNEMSSIAVNGANIYTTANLNANATVNGNTIVSNGKEGVVFHFNNGTLSWNQANAEDMVLNDILITSNNQVWVAGSFAGPTSWGNNLVAKYPTAILCQFNSNLSTNTNVFYIDDKNSVFSKASAVALSERNGQLYAAGTYTGQIIGMKQVVNPNNLVQAAGGLGNHNAMWLAALDLSATPSITWINNSHSSQPIQVYDVATDGFNSYVVGSYKDHIQLPPSSNLNNPTNGALELGYIIRGGAAYGQPAFYKIATTNSNQTHSAAQLDDKSSLATSKQVPTTSSLKTNHTNALSATDLNVFPNPNSGRFTMQLESLDKGTVHLNITDVSGRSIHQQTTEKHNTTTTLEISPKSLPKGIYILHVELNGNQQHCKFLVH